MCPFLCNKILYEKFHIRLSHLPLHIKTAFLFQKDTLTYETTVATNSTIRARQTINLLREWQRALVFHFPEDSMVCSCMPCSIDPHTHLIRYLCRAAFELGSLTPKNTSSLFLQLTFWLSLTVHF